MSIINLQDKNLYYIGGIVRDEILGKESFDVDITYVGNAIEFAESIPNAEIIQINKPFGTVKIRLNGREIDIASTRNETYPKKGHLPVVSEIGCLLEKDVLRRDFTINALAKSTLTGEIIDYTGGLKDIKDKTLRIIHDDSFIDDPTRIVRGLKFAIRFGFKLDEHTKKLQDKYLANINYDISYKRLKKELTETFNLNSQKAFEIFVKDKIYKLISPIDFKLPKTDFEKLVNKYSPKNIWIIYVGQLPDVSSLPLTKTENKIVQDYKKLCALNLNDDISDFEIYEIFKGISLESIIMYTDKNQVITKRYLDNLMKIKIEITGQDLINLGLTPSDKFQKCFDFVLSEKFKNPKMAKDEELKLAKEFILL